MDFFISAISTDCGKTLVSAIFCRALAADYWKPVQSGLPRDTESVKGLVMRDDLVFHPETYLLKKPASPHESAEEEGIRIDLSQIKRPNTRNHLIVEGAGGLLVPLNEQNYVYELAQHLNIPLILVSNYYLGSINHTLLSLEFLKQKGLGPAGLIFNGNENPQSKKAILNAFDVPVLLEIPQLEKITPEIVDSYAGKLKISIEKYFGKG